MSETVVPPERIPGEELGSAIARATFGAIPFVGPAIGEALSSAITVSARRRQRTFYEEVAAKLHELEEAGRLNSNRVASNDAFAASMVKASISAATTADDEKIELLRNAVLNTAIDSEADSHSMRETYLRLVDELSVLHVRTLQRISDGRYVSPGKSLFGGRIAAKASYSSESILFVARELEARGLANGQLYQRETRMSSMGKKPSEAMYGKGAIRWQISEMGEDFLKFLSDPTDAD